MTQITISTPNKINDSVVSLQRSPVQDIQFSAMDYDTVVRSIYEYIRTYYPNTFDNFTPDDGLVMLIEIVGSITDKLSLRNDLTIREAIWKTSSSVEATSKLMEMIGAKFRNSTPAVVEIECRLDSPLGYDLFLNPGIPLTTNGPDGDPVFYEVYKGPDDYHSSIFIPAGKLGVVAWGVEGRRSTAYTRNSTGGPNQSYKIVQDNVLLEGMEVYITRNGVRVDYLITDGPVDRMPFGKNSVEVRRYDGIDGRPTTEFVFSDSIERGRPNQGDTINILYRTGGGSRGRIPARAIDQTAVVRHDRGTTRVSFRNALPSVGGFEAETVSDAKRRASETFSRHGCIVSSADYVSFCNSFTKPGFGSISKSSLVVDDFDIYIYVVGNGFNSLPAVVGNELKEALLTAIRKINPVTDTVYVLDGIIKPVDIDVSLVLDQNGSAENVRINAEQIIRSMFSVDSNDMGKPFHISTLISSLRSIPDVRYVDVASPTYNIASSGNINNTSEDYVGINEILTLGSLRVACSYI